MNTMSNLREYEVLRDIDRRIANLENSMDRALGNLKSELRLFHQETIHYRASMIDRLEKLEENRNQSMVDWQAVIRKFWESLWFKLALAAAAVSGNTHLTDLVLAAFQKQ